MAKIISGTNENVYKITRWQGLNENPDGDTKLKPGEASAMRNFRITRDGNLQIRPGYKTVYSAGSRIRGIWHGNVNGTDYTVFAAGGKLYTFDFSTNAAAQIGTLTDDDTFFFGFARKLYILNGHEYLEWTGPYRIYTYTAPSKLGAGDYCFTAEGVTRLFTLGASLAAGKTIVFDGFEKTLTVNGAETACAEGTASTETDLTSGFVPSDAGKTAGDAAGYRPLVAVAAAPAGGGTGLEQVNKLNGLRRVRFSPDGKATTFQLPEKGLESVDYVKSLVTGLPYFSYTAYAGDGRVVFYSGTMSESFTGSGVTTVFELANANVTVTGVTVGGTSVSNYVYDMAVQRVTFTSAPSNGAAVVISETPVPAAGTDTIEIGYTVKTDYRAQVTAMRYAELYSGATDNRVFLYGDGSNRAFYSGLDYDGNPRADYFPDLGVLDVGTANTPVTALIRHYSSLAVFKSDSAYSVRYGTVTLADGTTAAAFYTTPINRAIGNIAPGQVQLVDNNPRTLFGSAVYEWKNGSGYSANLTADERQAKRISDRIYAALGEMDLASAVAYDDNARQEYYIVQNGTALVHNYVADAWTVYTDFPMTALIAVGGNLYGCTASGGIARISRDWHNDDGAAIDAYWRSGALAFDRDWQRKYSAEAFITIKPETHAQVKATIQTNEKSNFDIRTISHGQLSFSAIHFAHWSFGTNRKPQTTKLKMKAKKFAYYQLILESGTDWSTATVLAADVKVRYGGDVK